MLNTRKITSEESWSLMAEMMQRREEWNVCHMTGLCFITVLPYWDGSWKVGNFRWSRECIEKARRQFKSLNRLTSLGGLWGLVCSMNKHQRFRLSLIFDSLNVQSRKSFLRIRSLKQIWERSSISILLRDINLDKWWDSLISDFLFMRQHCQRNYFRLLSPTFFRTTLIVL